MKGLIEIYRQQFKTTFAMMLQYRAALLIWMIAHVLEPLVYLIVWSTVSNTSGGSVGNYSTREFAAYFIALMLVNHMTYTWIMYELEYRIREGTFSFALLKPLHPIHSDIADNITSKLVTLPFMLLVALGLAALFHPLLSPQPWAIAAALPAIMLAFLLRFFLEWTLAQAAFWTTRVSAFNQIYFVLILFLSGQVAPLTLFPGWVQTIADFLPFRWMVSFPVELLLGRLTPMDAGVGLAAQILWLLVGLLLIRTVWRAGLRKYTAVGA